MTTRAEAIFIVGISRSGTTLMRTLLERSDVIAIAMENHYLGHLLPKHGARHAFARLGPLDDDATLRRIVEYIYSGEMQRRSRLREISPFWRWLIAEVPRDEVERRLLAAERTERGIFEAFLRLYADQHAKQVIGEKTPAHLAFAELLFEWFPGARIIHMLRDPRAIFVSEVRRRRKRRTPPYRWLMWLPGVFELAMLLQVALTWSRAVRRHAELAQAEPDRYLMVRFEDLVQQPEQALRRVFDFVGVEMPPDATAVSVVSRGYNLGAEGLDAAAADRWREQINPLARRLLTLLVRGRLRALGYAP